MDQTLPPVSPSENHNDTEELGQDELNEVQFVANYPQLPLSEDEKRAKNLHLKIAEAVEQQQGRNNSGVCAAMTEAVTACTTFDMFKLIIVGLPSTGGATGRSCTMNRVIKSLQNLSFLPSESRIAWGQQKSAKSENQQKIILSKIEALYLPANALNLNTVLKAIIPVPTGKHAPSASAGLTQVLFSATQLYDYYSPSSQGSEGGNEDASGGGGPQREGVELNRMACVAEALSDARFREVYQQTWAGVPPNERIGMLTDGAAESNDDKRKIVFEQIKYLLAHDEIGNSQVDVYPQLGFIHPERAEFTSPEQLDKCITSTLNTFNILDTNASRSGQGTSGVQGDKDVLNDIGADNDGENLEEDVAM